MNRDFSRVWRGIKCYSSLRCLYFSPALNSNWIHIGIAVPSLFQSRKSGIFRKEVIHPQLRLGIPCYDLSLIAEFGLPLIREVHPPPTLLPWRAVCTRPENVFTAACWSAITTDSDFMGSSFRPQSELRRNLRDSLAIASLPLVVFRHCSVCVAQGIRAVLTWRLPLLPSLKNRDRP